MSEVWLRYVMQSSPLPGALSPPDICQVALEQAAWADDKGFASLQLGEHHGNPDDYNPSPIVLGAAFAARTKRLRLHAIIMLPFHDPVRIAEDLLVLDTISRGRVDVTIGLGYVPSELAMFGI